MQGTDKKVHVFKTHLEYYPRNSETSSSLCVFIKRLDNILYSFY